MRFPQPCMYVHVLLGFVTASDVSILFELKLPLKIISNNNYSNFATSRLAFTFPISCFIVLNILFPLFVLFIENGIYFLQKGVSWSNSLKHSGQLLFISFGFC